MRQIELIPPGLMHNLREGGARFAINGAHFARGFLLAHQRSRICRPEVNFLANKILTQQSGLPLSQLGQRIVRLASSRLTVPDQIDAAHARGSFSIMAAASPISPRTRRSKLRKRSSCVCPR